MKGLSLIEYELLVEQSAGTVDPDDETAVEFDEDEVAVIYGLEERGLLCPVELVGAAGRIECHVVTALGRSAMAIHEAILAMGAR